MPNWNRIKKRLVCACFFSNSLLLALIELFRSLSQGNARFVWFSSLCQIYSMHLYVCFIVSWVLCHKKFSFLGHVHTPHTKDILRLFSQSFRPRYAMCNAAFDCLSFCLFTQNVDWTVFLLTSVAQSQTKQNKIQYKWTIVLTGCSFTKRSRIIQRQSPSKSKSKLNSFIHAIKDVEKKRNKKKIPNERVTPQISLYHVQIENNTVCEWLFVLR